MYTRSTSRADAIANRRWFVVDLDEQTLGRAAARIAHVLRGKHVPSYTPHIDDGDYVVVVNAEKVHLTGRKWADKIYYHHTGYIGGIKGISAQQMREKHPAEIIRKAVKGMLPRGPLGRAQLRKLKVYVGSEHPHTAQRPEPLDLSKLF